MIRAISQKFSTQHSPVSNAEAIYCWPEMYIWSQRKYNFDTMAGNTGHRLYQHTTEKLGQHELLLNCKLYGNIAGLQMT